MITAQQVREILAYDPCTGSLIWRVAQARRVKVGDVAGHITKRGYVQIRLFGRSYKGHRIVWLHVHGEWPVGEVDHRNGKKSDNRLTNLRDATPFINHQNLQKACDRSATGLLGVIPDRERWRARIIANNKAHSLGTFDTPELAHAAYIKAKPQLHQGCTI